MHWFRHILNKTINLVISLNDNSSILNIQAPFWVVEDEIEWLTLRF